MNHKHNKSPLTLVVLAAGIGARYGGAKQVDSFGPNDELLLDYSLYDAWMAGFSKVVFVVRKELRPFFDEHFGRLLNGKMEFDLVEQRLTDIPDDCSMPAGRCKPWGTGHAVWVAKDFIESPFAVINADDFYGRRSYLKHADFMREQLQDSEEREEQLLGGLVGFRLGNTLSEHGSVSRGVCKVDDADNLRAVQEHTAIERQAGGTIRGKQEDGLDVELAPETIVSMNMWGFSTSFIPLLDEQLRAFFKSRKHSPDKEFYLPAAVNSLLAEKRCQVKVIPSPETWIGVTYAADKKQVENFIRELVRKRVYPEYLVNSDIA